MILDLLEALPRYAALNSRFDLVVDALRRMDVSSMPDGHYEIDGQNVFLILSEGTGKGRQAARLEAHERYIDIQISLAGTEEIGWKTLWHCRSSLGIFDTAKDIIFFSDAPDSWVSVPPGHFAIFFPEDAHAPLAGTGPLRKAIFKIIVDE